VPLTRHDVERKQDGKVGICVGVQIGVGVLLHDTPRIRGASAKLVGPYSERFCSRRVPTTPDSAFSTFTAHETSRFGDFASRFPDADS